MPVKALITPLRPGLYYHIYNRGNNKERLFFHRGDYQFFMTRYKEYLDGYLTTYGYCLLPNHFHLLVQIKDGSEENSKMVSNQLRKLFICHARRINTREARSGSLLTKNYRRIEIADQEYLRNLLLYIHYNPVKHGLLDSFADYQYSSFRLILADKMPGVKQDEIFDWYGGMEQFLEQHHFIKHNKGLRNFINDD